MNQPSKKDIVRVQVLMYSGRPNPSWELHDAEAREVLERINRVLAGRPITAQTTPRLGFQGYAVSVEGEARRTYEVVGGTVRHLGVSPPTRHADDAGVGDLLRNHSLSRGYKPPP